MDTTPSKRTRRRKARTPVKNLLPVAKGSPSRSTRSSNHSQQQRESSEDSPGGSPAPKRGRPARTRVRKEPQQLK